ncbi:hypothetical protein [Actinophytocola algeriensis]|uniref:Uncharacterized protein n=1 Tax=Actinophytocola algeriensis TaxID=1768010 RepID=A0A7W7Q362_9PSEU|nr:hypothetical protein [Actinophytocola algeriensis]MBB4906212.1 hypothetical protein [Actinophytocola algeriensis]MBE1472103.1 hypothetical protein [Actinophytocola algeriensis]
MNPVADLNVLCRLRGIYRDIDRCLDTRDPRGFSRASLELRDVLSRLRDLIDNTSVADITSVSPPMRSDHSQPPQRW